MDTLWILKQLWQSWWICLWILIQLWMWTIGHKGEFPTLMKTLPNWPWHTYMEVLELLIILIINHYHHSLIILDHPRSLLIYDLQSRLILYQWSSIVIVHLSSLIIFHWLPSFVIINHHYWLSSLLATSNDSLSAKSHFTVYLPLSELKC